MRTRALRLVWNVDIGSLNEPGPTRGASSSEESGEESLVVGPVLAVIGVLLRRA